MGFFKEVEWQSEMEILLQGWAASWCRLHSPGASQTSKNFFSCLLITYSYPAKFLEQIFLMVLQEQWEPDPEFIADYFAFRNKLRVKGRKKGKNRVSAGTFIPEGWVCWGEVIFLVYLVFINIYFWIQRFSLSWISVPMKTFGVGSDVGYFQPVTRGNIFRERLDPADGKTNTKTNKETGQEGDLKRRK